MLRATKFIPSLRPSPVLQSAHFLATRRRSERCTMLAAGDNPQAEAPGFQFGKYPIDASEVTQSVARGTGLTAVALADVLICPKRVLPRFDDLSAEEVSDLWLTAKLVGKKVEKHFHASSLTFAIQDGPQAGQTVPHVHIHILPRKTGDFKENDEIYEEIDHKEQELAQKLDLDQERKDRTPDEMAKEAAELRALFC